MFPLFTVCKLQCDLDNFPLPMFVDYSMHASGSVGSRLLFPSLCSSLFTVCVWELQCLEV
jgi:hypothetical protein